MLDKKAGDMNWDVIREVFRQRTRWTLKVRVFLKGQFCIHLGFWFPGFVTRLFGFEARLILNILKTTLSLYTEVFWANIIRTTLQMNSWTVVKIWRISLLIHFLQHLFGMCNLQIYINVLISTNYRFCSNNKFRDWSERCTMIHGINNELISYLIKTKHINVDMLKHGV